MIDQDKIMVSRLIMRFAIDHVVIDHVSPRKILHTLYSKTTITLSTKLEIMNRFEALESRLKIPFQVGMGYTLIHLILVSAEPGSYPKYAFKITFKLDRFKAQLRSYTSNLVQWVHKPLYGLYKTCAMEFYPYRENYSFTL